MALDCDRAMASGCDHGVFGASSTELFNGQVLDSAITYDDSDLATMLDEAS